MREVIRLEFMKERGLCAGEIRQQMAEEIKEGEEKRQKMAEEIESLHKELEALKKKNSR